MRSGKVRAGVVVFVLGATVGACGSDSEPDAAGGAPAAATSEVGESSPQRGAGLPRLGILHEPMFGDLDAILERRSLRVLVAFDRTFYFLDGANQRGASFEAVSMFLDELNKRYPESARPIKAVFLPTPRDRIMTELAEGYGDIAAAGLTITDARSELVDFSDALAENVMEVVVTGPAAPALSTLRDLAGQEIWVRGSSSYAQSLATLSADLEGRGLEAIKVRHAHEALDDEDLLEMVDAGILPMVVVDSYKGTLWGDVFQNITFREDLPVATGQRLAWAMRKDSPQLVAEVNDFVRTHRQGTLMGNIVINRYFRDNEWVRNNVDDESQNRVVGLAAIFEQYADEYDFDWMLMAAQGFQESGLDQSVRSSAGAVGVMQLLPSTAADPQVDIADIHLVENNVHAGAKYLRFLLDHYFDDAELDELNRHLFAFAAYNAGPARVRRLRTAAAAAGYDENVWFGNVEVVAARDVGQEPVVYVRNIFQYYIAYRLIQEQLDARRRALEQ